MFLVYYLLRFVCYSVYLLVKGPHACCSAHFVDKPHCVMVCLPLRHSLLDCGSHNICLLVKLSHACCSACVHGKICLQAPA